MLEPQYIGTVLYIGSAIFAALLAAALLMQERKYSVKKTAMLWGLTGIVILLDLYFCYGLLPKPLQLPASMIIGFLCYMGMFIYVSADSFWKKCYLLITYICVCCISWSGGLYLCYFFLPNSTEAVKYLVRVLAHIATSLPLLIAYRNCLRPLIREVSGFHKQNWMRLSGVSALYFCIFASLMTKIRLENGINADTLLIFCIIVCTFTAVNILSISNIYQMRQEAMHELVKQNVEYLTAYVENVSKAEQENRRIRHDKRHHDECIAAMARAGDTEGILHYLGQEKEKTESFPAWCPHIMVNGILSSYAGKAKEAGVEYIAQTDTPAQSAIADIDFVAILANLLENALNACVEINSLGPIRTHIKNVGAKTVIAVSNPCDAGLKLENGLPVARSIGIDSIITSAVRYQGEVNYKIQDGICTACVILNP